MMTDVSDGGSETAARNPWVRLRERIRDIQPTGEYPDELPPRPEIRETALAVAAYLEARHPRRIFDQLSVHEGAVIMAHECGHRYIEVEIREPGRVEWSVCSERRHVRCRVWESPLPEIPRGG